MKKSVWAVRSILVLCILATTGFIFSQSLKSRTESSSASLGVTNVLLRLFGVAPDQMSEARLETVEKVVRKIAHFAEYALLGALWFWLVRSFQAGSTPLWVSPATCFLTACADELIQLFSDGRASSFWDVLLDLSGAVCGALFAWLTVYIALKIQAKRVKRENKG
ncbi:MAG: VanZ family protein [Clostridia bacterium]|nr:VanZ family protein [Clostridia bacterium]